MTYCW